MGKSTQKQQYTKGQWRVWEPEWNDDYSHVGRIIIGKPRKNDCEQEIAYVNCDSTAFEGQELVPIKSEFRNDAQVPVEALQNAKLIASAPKMLAMCQRIWKAYLAYGPVQEAGNELEDALSALGKLGGINAK